MLNCSLLSCALMCIERGARLMVKSKIFEMSFASIYPLYIKKAEKKGRTKDEVDEIIFWLTAYDDRSLSRHIEDGTNLEAFFNNAPRINPDASRIKGVICGCRVEEIEDETMRNIRYLDKLIDELAKGKSMDQIFRR